MTRSVRSCPAQNPRPLAVIRRVRMPASLRTRCIASRSSSCIAAVNAFNLSGRFKVSVATPASISNRIVSKDISILLHGCDGALCAKRALLIARKSDKEDTPYGLRKHPGRDPRESRAHHVESPAGDECALTGADARARRGVERL